MTEALHLVSDVQHLNHHILLTEQLTQHYICILWRCASLLRPCLYTNSINSRYTDTQTHTRTHTDFSDKSNFKHAWFKNKVNLCECIYYTHCQVLLVRTLYSHCYTYLKDNELKHTLRITTDFFTENSINWWKTVPESPDLNQIENLWHKLKEYMRRNVKPRKKEE